MTYPELLTKSSITVYVKPNSKKTQIIKFDESKNAYILSVKAKPENNKANLEIERFLSKISNKNATIVKGFKAKTKLVRLD